MEITRREVLISIAILLLMLGIGIAISEKIASKYDEKNDIYNQALKIEDNSDTFAYAMKTNAGYAFVSGKLTAVDPVNYPEIDGDFMAIEKVEEEYTKHTKQVSHTKTDSNGHISTYYTTEAYWTWDVVDRENIHCKQITFCGITFDYGKIYLENLFTYISTVKENSHVRYVYYGIPIEANGTIFAKLENKSIPDDTEFFENMSVNDAFGSCIARAKLTLIIFWIFWILLTIRIVFSFCTLENRWLED